MKTREEIIEELFQRSSESSEHDQGFIEGLMWVLSGKSKLKKCERCQGSKSIPWHRDLCRDCFESVLELTDKI